MPRRPTSSNSTVFVAACALLACAGTLFHSQAWAERRFPQKAQRGQITFTAIPDLVVDGVPERAAHTLLIHNERNTTLVYSRVNGLTAIVNYLRDNHGAVREVWILTPQEIATPLAATTTPASAAPLPGQTPSSPVLTITTTTNGTTTTTTNGATTTVTTSPQITNK